MSKDALTVLREARELISDPKRWTTGVMARSALGAQVTTSDQNACRFCAAGAIKRAFGSGNWLGPIGILERTSHDLFNHSVVYVNDQLGHEATLRMFDAAIASAEKEAQS